MTTTTQEPHLSDLEAIAHAGDFFRELLDQLADGVYFVDPQRRILFWSQGAERITGFRAEEVMGTRCAEDVLRHVDEGGNCLCTGPCPLAATILDGERRAADAYLHHKDGHRLPVSIQTSPLLDRQGRIIGGIEAFHDNSARQADLQRIRTLEELALLDPLTGIGNRRFGEMSLRNRMAELRRSGLRFGLIMMDVDRFKDFNDLHGHNAGDQALRTVARTISASLRPFDTVCRWGGEEFLIVAGIGSAEELRGLAERVRVLVQRSEVTHEGRSLEVTVSLGVTGAHPTDTAQGLVDRADRLMYQSKEAGRNRTTIVA